MLGIHVVLVDTSWAKFKFSFYTSRPSARQWSLIPLCLHQDPLRGNGHWFPSIYIKNLCEAMVIDFLMSQRGPLQSNSHDFSHHRGPLRGNGHWFLMSHWGPLRGNGHRSLYIEALFEVMVIDLFTLRLSARQWSIISYVTSRPSTRQWSSISLHQGPLRGNGHGSLYIKTLCEAMVIDFLCHIEALCEAMVIDLFTSRPSTRQW